MSRKSPRLQTVLKHDNFIIYDVRIQFLLFVLEREL